MGNQRSGEPGSGRCGSVHPSRQAPRWKRIASNSEHFLRDLACQGLGIARLADFHVARDLREGRLLPLLESFRLDEPIPILAVLPSNRHMTARVRLFLRFLEQRLEQAVA